jgi:TolA-binding protein
MVAEPFPQEPDMIEIRARRFDLRALWRLSAWGGAAAVALTAAAFVSQTDKGSQRVQMALATAELPVKPVATVRIPPHNEQDAQIKRLEGEVRTLAADRDRLAERVASLEHNVEDMTGSIRRQATPAMPPILSMVPAPDAPPAASAASPVVSSPAMVESKETAKPAPAHSQAEAPDRTAAAEQSSSAPDEASPPSTAVPMPPVRIAAAPAAEAAPPKPEFGVALASASSLDLMRMQWLALKANYGPLLAGLHPFAAREQHGSSVRYRLVAGPLPNYAAAARLCTRMNTARAVCHAGKFTGEPL